MEELLLDSEPQAKICKIVKSWTWEYNRFGNPFKKYVYCGGQLIRTVISESPRIQVVQCNKCGYGWLVKNGFIYPVDQDELSILLQN